MTEYEKYIRTAELLGLQKPRDAQVCHDELAFQVVHQVEELWMKLALQEVDLLVERIDADRLVEAMDVLKRLREILRLMAAQMGILETLSPRAYFTIRGALGRGSGQESPGFNQMLETRRPIRRALRDLFERRSVDLLALHRDPSADPEVFALTEGLVDYDEGFQQFRYRHLALVRRIIGGRTPSLKGAPAELLEHGVRQSFFPELWQVREALFRDFTPGRPLFDDTDPPPGAH